MSKQLKEEDFTPQELEKCKNSPLYFYNKYVRKAGMREVTEEQYLGIMRDAELIKNGFPPSWKMRKRNRDYPLTKEDCTQEWYKK